jgi:hypothetical protein
MSDVSIKMLNPMITVANYVLQQKEIKGRKEMRDHKRVMTALLNANSAEDEVVINGQKSKQKITKEGPLVMEKADWETLYAYCEDKIAAGYPASLNDGMCDLMDAIENIVKVEPEKEGDEKVTPIGAGKKK